MFQANAWHMPGAKEVLTVRLATRGAVLPGMRVLSAAIA
jgi:hypothetical protein